MSTDADESFEAVLRGIRDRSGMAEEAVFRRFAGRLVALARARLDQRLRAKVDPEDVVQSVFRSFFVRCASDQFDLGTWDSLWSLLTVITIRKCAGQVRHFTTEGRDVRRERAEEPADGASGPHWDPAAAEPTPAEAAALAELVEGLMQSLEPRDRWMVEMKLQGEPVPQIARQARCSERTVERVLNRARRHLERSLDPE